MEIRIVCRKSPLAVLQANKFVEAIQKKYGKAIKCKLIPMHSKGDLTDKNLSQIGGKGLFVSELESSLASGNADVAIHSLKDVPAKLNDGFEIIGCLKRGNPNDVIILKQDGPSTIHELNNHSKIATSSPRRKAQWKIQNPTFEFVPIRGNISTRISKFLKSDLNGLLMAATALERLNIKEHHYDEFNYQDVVPSVCQGIIGMEIYQGTISEEKRQIIQSINHQDSFLAASMEREVIKFLDADCMSPIGVICHGGMIYLDAFNKEGTEIYQLREALISTKLKPALSIILEKLKNDRVHELITK
tara:strand:+ start:32 stop:940 length:909 start_codon:yes stop_codon:yes gene_type:complete